MTDSSSLKKEIAQLRAENQQLSEQVKRLVRAERRMIEFQDKLDAQVAVYRQLNEISRQLSKTFSIVEIFKYTIHCIIYKHNFERCLLLRNTCNQQFQFDQCDGYYDDDSTIASISLTYQHPAFQSLLTGAEVLIGVQEDADSAVQDLSDRIEMDEFVGFTIGELSNPQFLIFAGNTRDRAKYHCRIQADNDALLALVSLIQSTQTAITQANLYTQIRDRALMLEQTLRELQQTQTQLIQSEKMSSLGQLVAGVAHEINNPVSFIYGNVAHASGYANDLIELVKLYKSCYPVPDSLIQNKAEEIDIDFLVEDLPKLLMSMQTGADRIIEIVASLKIFSHMDESGSKAVDVHAGIDSTLMILQHRIKATSNRTAIEIIKDYGSLPLIECYAGQLNQVFMNLLSNAIDALEDHCEQFPNFIPQIRICTTTLDQTSVMISITDNGMGIPDLVQSRLFEPFFTTKPVGKGTGMGLSISHQIITERHKGQLVCTSKQNEGTTFCITLPSQAE